MARAHFAISLVLFAAALLAFVISRSGGDSDGEWIIVVEATATPDESN